MFGKHFHSGFGDGFLWAVWKHSQTGDNVAQAVGVLSFVVGFALIVYVVYLVRKLDKAKIE